MNNYILTLETKTANIYINSYESVMIHADSLVDAIKIGRRFARNQNMRFVRVCRAIK